MISVVMAAKNYARFLPMAVESVFAQSHTDWELVVVDDGSTDETPKAVKPYLADRRVQYHRTDKLGQPRAKNLGVRLSRGEVIAFLDADDAWRPMKLEKQLPHLTGDVGVVCCYRDFLNEAGDIRPGDRPPVPPPTGQLDRLFVQNFVCFSSAMVRRQVFDHVGGFDPEYDVAIDYELWLRVARHYHFVCVPEPLVLYRTGHGNLSQKLADRVATAFSIMHRHKEGISPKAIAEGTASTCRTMGWVYRRSEPTTAIQWYADALRWPHRRWESLKGLLVSATCQFRSRRPTAAENRSENR